LGLFLIAVPSPDALAQATNWILENAPEKAQPPDLKFVLYGLSSIFVIGFGASVYPQAIQRIYAAKSTKVLKRAFSFMIFMPLFTVLILYLLGVVSIQHFNDLTGGESDTALPRFMAILAEQSDAAYYLMVMVIVGVMAALMSTADSVLLSTSSILAIDVFGKRKNNTLSNTELTKLGKRISVALMIVLIVFAMIPDLLVYKIAEYKFMLSSHTAPAFILGLSYPKLKAKTVLKGLIAGLGISIVLMIVIRFSFPAKVAVLLDIMAGAVGLIINFGIGLWGRNGGDDN